MMRVRTLALTLLLAPVLVARVGAQEVQLYTVDSALIVLTNDSAAAELRVVDSRGVSSYDITMFFADTRVTLVRADSVPGSVWAAPSITTGSGFARLTLTPGVVGTPVTTSRLATLYFKVSGSAAEGSLVSMRVNSLVAADGATNLFPKHRTRLLNVCQALQVYGDIDGNRIVNSRDALIAMTAAVGLPVGGFDVTIGDVDQDLMTTTRDALMILSQGIGLYTGSQAGRNKANRCAPLATMPDAFAFYYGGNLATIAKGDSARVVGPPMYDGYYPSWAPDGSAVAFVSYVSTAPAGYKVIRANATTGTAIDTIQSVNDAYAAAWAPDGTRFAFVSGGQIYYMNADGANRVALSSTSGLYVEAYSRLAWSPDGKQLAFVAYETSACCVDRLWTMDAGDSVPPVKVFPDSSFYPVDPQWSPAGDSLVYDFTGESRPYRAASADVVIGVPAVFLADAMDYPAWSSNGIAINNYAAGRAGFFLRQSTGRVVRLTREVGTTYNRRGTFFRPSAAYVDSIEVTAPDSTLSAGQSTPRTTQATATVLDNNSTPISPGSGIQWMTSDPSIATVDATGLVTAVAPGTVVITASAGGWRKDTLTITVVP